MDVGIYPAKTAILSFAGSASLIIAESLDCIKSFQIFRNYATPEATLVDVGWEYTYIGKLQELC